MDMGTGRLWCGPQGQTKCTYWCGWNSNCCHQILVEENFVFQRV